MEERVGDVDAREAGRHHIFPNAKLRRAGVAATLDPAILNLGHGGAVHLHAPALDVGDDAIAHRPVLGVPDADSRCHGGSELSASRIGVTDHHTTDAAARAQPVG